MLGIEKENMHDYIQEQIASFIVVMDTSFVKSRAIDKGSDKTQRE